MLVMPHGGKVYINIHIMEKSLERMWSWAMPFTESANGGFLAETSTLVD
jgi:hypothetical protein